MRPAVVSDRAEAAMGERLSGWGKRLTAPRRHVYRLLLRELDHPTAEEVYVRVKQQLPEISLATVYNSLEALAECGLVRRLHVGAGAGRFCPNMSDHGHFYCERCGGVFDIAAPAGLGRWRLPRGFRVSGVELSLRGTCPRCHPRPRGLSESQTT